MTQEELYEIIASDESFRIELTTSTGDMDKFQEAICAFANDMPGSRKKGYLLIGVRNNGEIDGLKVDDVAGMMKTLNYVNMFNHGVGEVQDLLNENNSPAPIFNVNYLTVFSVIVKEPDETSLPKLAQVDRADYEAVMKDLSQAVPSLAQVTPKQMSVLLNICQKVSSLSNMMDGLSASSRRTFVRNILKPVSDAKLIAMTHPDNPRHPQQKYYLTELGLKVLDMLAKQQMD